VIAVRHNVFFTFAICILAPVTAQPMSPGASSGKLVARVPFVGCKSDGQTGPLPAPSGDSQAVAIAAEMAHRMAYYKAEHGFGVLAPRGWYCFATYGSNGDVLYVSPRPIDSANLFSSTWSGFRGPVIQIAHEYGDTSGRFGVARMIARVFPAHQAFVSKVIGEGIELAAAFPAGPYPRDKLTYRSKEIAEYQTPAQADGLGTNSRLHKNSSPTSGLAILMGPNPDLLFLAVRLPRGSSNLAPAIIRQVEREAEDLQQ
jgi:hypothetical protein